MPPIKGRMTGRQSNGEFTAIKRVSMPRLRAEGRFFDGVSTNPEHSAEEARSKLRIPESLCHKLSDMVANPDHEDGTKQEKGGMQEIDLKPAYVARSRGSCAVVSQQSGSKYRIVAECEHRFSGMVWDAVFLPTGDVVVCYGSGVEICRIVDGSLQILRTLGNIRMPGGVTITREGHIAIVDRFEDSVSIFTVAGRLQCSFQAGRSPMSIAVAADGNLLVTDVADKCMRVYSPDDGHLISTVPQRGNGYEMQWPLYVCVNTDSIYISDVLRQKVLVFDAQYSFVNTLPLKTHGANQVLRPHGICTASDDLFVVDNALDTVEVFRQSDNVHVQTLITTSAGSSLKPKSVVVSPDGKYVLIGGMTGTVHVYRFVDADDKVSVTTAQRLSNVITTPKMAGGKTRSNVLSTLPNVKLPPFTPKLEPGWCAGKTEPEAEGQRNSEDFETIDGVIIIN